MSDIETAEQFAKRIQPKSVKADWHVWVGADLKARDTTVARAAKAEVLREVIALSCQWISSTSGPVTASRLRSTHENVYEVAARHGITLAELEPAKVYTVGDIKLDWHDFSAEGQKPHIICGEYAWCGDRWESGGSGYFYKSKHDAEAIAAHLRAAGNVPGGGA